MAKPIAEKYSGAAYQGTGAPVSHVKHVRHQTAMHKNAATGNASVSHAGTTQFNRRCFDREPIADVKC